MTEFLTTKEVAEALRVSKRGVDSLCASGRLAYYKLGSKRLFDPADIQKMLQEIKVEAK